MPVAVTCKGNRVKLFNSLDIAKMTRAKPKAKRRCFVVHDTSPMQKIPQNMEADLGKRNGDSSHNKSSWEIRSANPEYNALCTQQAQNNLVVHLGHQLGKLSAMKREEVIQQQKMYVLSDDSDASHKSSQRQASGHREGGLSKGRNGNVLCVECNFLDSSSTLWSCVKISI